MRGGVGVAKIRRMLLLFDVDMTLITTGGAGRDAMEEAGRHLFGPGFTREGVRFGGCLDPVILIELLRRNAILETPENIRRLGEGYFERIEVALRANAAACRPLPGVPELLDAVEAQGWTLGLLTGNFERSGRMKLRACELDPDRFTIRVWGDESPDEPHERHKLVGVAIERWCCPPTRPKDLSAECIVVIGDTPHDVACGLRHGARVLGVCTGNCDREELIAAGASHVVANLADVGAVVRWIQTGAANNARC